MAGRVHDLITAENFPDPGRHDLITAENFAKWAEGQERIPDPGRLLLTGGCAVAQFLRAVGFPKAEAGWTYWHPTPDAPPVKAWWMHRVTVAYDDGERSGPTLAKIARENA